MCKLVRLTTQDVSRAIPVTDSLMVAEYFGKVHKTIIRNIETLLETSAQNCANLNGWFLVSEYKDSYGRNQKKYDLTRDGFSLLVMGFTGSKALKFKIEFINQFNFMEKELQVREKTRHISVKVRKSLTESIKENVIDDGKFKSFAYSNYTKLIYKKVFGKDVKKLKEERNVPNGGNIRDYFAVAELEVIQALESKIATYIEAWKVLELSDKEIYDKIKNKI
ncbi:MAG: Rha family transcriptional regulator [Fusobacteriaceae bacterium]